MITWTPGMTLEQVEKQVIIACFNFCLKNKTRTAQTLGIAIRTLDNKLEKYAKEEEDRKKAEEVLQENDQKRLNLFRNGYPKPMAKTEPQAKPQTKAAAKA